jgi:hypothetical protein
MRIKLDNVTGSLARAKQLEEGSGDSLKSQQQLVEVIIKCTTGRRAFALNYSHENQGDARQGAK